MEPFVTLEDNTKYKCDWIIRYKHVLCNLPATKKDPITERTYCEHHAIDAAAQYEYEEKSFKEN